MELLLFLAYAFFSASWMVGSIITTDMAQEFGVYTIPSSVNNAISAAKILGNFVAAWILLKLGPKHTVSLSCSPAPWWQGPFPPPSPSSSSPASCWALAGRC